MEELTGQMTHAAARVAGLLVEVATIAGVVATTIGVAALLAVAGNMADLAALTTDLVQASDCGTPNSRS